MENEDLVLKRHNHGHDTFSVKNERFTVLAALKVKFSHIQPLLYIIGMESLEFFEFIT
jgi:hypothetical protein